MDSSNAEKAWEAAAQTPEFVGAAHGGLAYRVFMAGAESRDAEVEVLREQLAAAEAAKVRAKRILYDTHDMLHWGCDNPDHHEAYQQMSQALGYAPATLRSGTEGSGQ